MNVTYQNWEYRVDGHCISLTSRQASIIDAQPPDQLVVEELPPRNPKPSRRARGVRVQKQPWIRPGWTYVERTRKSGKRAGSKYREYFDPTGKKYRAKKDALKVSERSN